MRIAMGVENWPEEDIQAYLHMEVMDWFIRYLNPLPVFYTVDTYTRFEIRSFLEIDPSTLPLPRWPDRAWSIIAESWIGEAENKAERKAAGMLAAIWYDHFQVVDLLEFCVLQGSFDAPAEMLHQELLAFLQAHEPPLRKPMSQASRMRWSRQVDYKGRLLFPLTEDEINEIKNERAQKKLPRRSRQGG